MYRNKDVLMLCHLTLNPVGVKPFNVWGGGIVFQTYQKLNMILEILDESYRRYF